MLIQVLGAGCAKCQKMADITEKAIAEIGMDASLEKVTEVDRILMLGVMITPALLIDGKLKFSGRVPTLEEMKRLLESLNEA